jgi:hypothetical protein
VLTPKENEHSDLWFGFKDANSDGKFNPGEQYFLRSKIYITNPDGKTQLVDVEVTQNNADPKKIKM